MKALVALLGLITACFLPGEADIAVRIRAYSETGHFALEQGNVLRGTRLLLICDVEGLPEGAVVNSYKWYHSCSTGICEIQRESPFYTAVNDTLLVDATTWDDGRRRHICQVKYHSAGGRTSNVTGFTASISLTDSTTPFFHTPTSILLNHSLITNVQQIPGSNGQQRINCTSGSRAMDAGGVQILSARNSRLISGNRMNTAGIGPERYPSNGLYYCLEGQAPRYYISLFLKNSSNLPTPIIHALGSTAWAFTSPDGSRVERHIVEFECKVRSITFVEKYMSVSASGGNVPVVRGVSCFGGQGQLYRVKVWAVSGPNISRQPAVKCLTPDGQCMKLVNTVDGPTQTTQGLTTIPTTAGSKGTPPRASTSTRSGTSSSTPSDTPSASPEHVDNSEGSATSIIVAPLSVSALMLLVGTATFIAGVVMLVRAKRVLHHSSQPSSPRIDHYEMVDEGVKRAPLGAGIYEEVDKQDTQTDGLTKYYQELDMEKMEKREYASIKA